MAENWRECKLGDIAKLSKKTWKVGDEEMPYIGLEHIEEAKLRIIKIGKSKDITSNKFRFQAGDILFGKLRPYFRKIIKPNFAGICSTDIWVINPQKNIDKGFLFYFFANKELIDISYSASSGTRMPRADWDFLSQTTWDIPPLQEQKAIAEILSSLDDKIDLLHRQNHTLESLANTLFRQWFIEEANPEWEEVKLGDYLIPKKGKNITKTQAIEGDYPVVAGGLEPSCYHNQSNTKSPVITISASGAAGFVRLYHTPVWASDCSYIDETITKYVYFFYTFLKYNQEVLINKQEGSVQQHIYPRHIMDLDILDYPINLIKEFENRARDIFSKVRQNSEQIQTLENLRDTLLPKLISGEVRVGA